MPALPGIRNKIQIRRRDLRDLRFVHLGAGRFHKNSAYATKVDLIALAQRMLTGDLLAVKKRSVGRIKIAQDHCALHPGDLGMATGNRIIVDEYVIIGETTDAQAPPRPIMDRRVVIREIDS